MYGEETRHKQLQKTKILNEMCINEGNYWILSYLLSQEHRKRQLKHYCKGTRLELLVPQTSNVVNWSQTWTPGVYSIHVDVERIRSKKQVDWLAHECRLRQASENTKYPKNFNSGGCYNPSKLWEQIEDMLFESEAITCQEAVVQNVGYSQSENTRTPDAHSSHYEGIAYSPTIEGINRGSSPEYFTQRPSSF